MHGIVVSGSFGPRTSCPAEPIRSQLRAGVATYQPERSTAERSPSRRRVRYGAAAVSAVIALGSLGGGQIGPRGKDPRAWMHGIVVSGSFESSERVGR